MSMDQGNYITSPAFCGGGDRHRRVRQETALPGPARERQECRPLCEERLQRTKAQKDAGHIVWMGPAAGLECQEQESVQV